MGLIGLKFEYIGYGSEHRILLLHVKNELESFVSLFPGFSWNLSVTTSEIHVACDGRDIFPPNWSEFCDLLHRLGMSELKDSFF